MPYSIEKDGRKWILYIRGKPFATHKTKKGAVAQMRAIEISKKERKGGRKVDEFNPDELDNTDDKYLESDRGRYDAWAAESKAKHKKMAEDRDRENYMASKLDPEGEQKKKQQIQRQQKLIQTDKRFRDSYYQSQGDRLQEFNKQNEAQAQQEADRINEIRDYEEQERQAEERSKDPWNAITDTFNDALAYIPVVGDVASTASKALTGALRGSGKYKCKKCNVSLKRTEVEEHVRSTEHGAGLIDWLKKGYKHVKEKIKFIFSDNKDFNLTSKKTLEQYGDYKVINVRLLRTPIQQMISTVLNAISDGKFNELVNSVGYDKLYHLAMEVDTDNGKKIIVEKNQSVNVSTSYNITDKTEVLNVSMSGINITLNEWFQNAIKRFGTKSIFYYDPFRSNCQFFISQMMQTINKYKAAERAFIFQNVEHVRHNLDDKTKTIMQAATDLGALVDRATDVLQGGSMNDDGSDSHPAMRGWDLHAVIIKKDIPLEEAITKSREFIKGKNKKFMRETMTSYRFRNLPKTKFNEFKTKRINKSISLIYGKLK